MVYQITSGNNVSPQSLSSISNKQAKKLLNHHIKNSLRVSFKNNQTSIEKNSSGKNDKLITVSIWVGIVASIAIILYFGKTLLASSKHQTKELYNKIKDAVCPDEVKNKLFEEYEKMRTAFVDRASHKNYIDNVLKLPWNASAKKELIDIPKAQKVLDANHIGMESVKEEIIKFLNVRNYDIQNKIEQNGPLIICLDGPPGVGKTSIGQSIAEAMDTSFQRISLGGISYDNFIKGSDRVYRGAEPGQIIKAFQNAGRPDPVILIDEIDKMGASTEHGNPAFAMLDVLESKQCKIFTDKYLGIPYDLSNATFIITSNDLAKIPRALKDRLNVIINVKPYSRQEKIAICKFNIEKLMKSNKLSKENVEFVEDGIAEIIKSADDLGARKTMNNLQAIFSSIKVARLHNPHNKVVVDEAFVRNALKNVQSDNNTRANAYQPFQYEPKTASTEKKTIFSSVKNLLHKTKLKIFNLFRSSKD